MNGGVRCSNCSHLMTQHGADGCEAPVVGDCHPVEQCACTRKPCPEGLDPDLCLECEEADQ